MAVVIFGRRWISIRSIEDTKEGLVAFPFEI